LTPVSSILYTSFPCLRYRTETHLSLLRSLDIDDSNLFLNHSSV
jgi:hypothetical protein